MTDKERARAIAENVDFDIGDWDGFGCPPSYEVGPLVAAIAAALAEARAEEREEAAKMADQWSRPSALRLAAGEMTAAELRTAQAVARGLAAAIRSRT